MKIYQLICILVSIIGIVNAEIYNYDEPGWDGYYIWAPRNPNANALEVNLYRHMIRKPGGSGQLLVHGLLTNAAAGGIGEVYWRLDNGEGRLLFPSEDSNSVLRWSNSGIDFSQVDYPALALEKAGFLNLDIYLVADPDYFEEAQDVYPNASIVTEIPGDISGIISEVDLYVETAAGSYLDQRVWYFRRDFNVNENIRSGYLCITAIENYECYVNGYYIGGSDSFDIGEIYDITSHLVVGENSIAVKVFPPSQYAGSITTNCAGLIVNAHWFDYSGAHSVITDNSWKCNSASVDGWYEKVFDSSGWANASIVGYWGTFAYPYYRILRPDGLLKEPDSNVVLLDQDFEDEDVFRTEIGFSTSGKGDSGQNIGFWRNPISGGDYEPKAVFGNSVFSSGSKCLRLLRGSKTGTGYLEGRRDNLAITGKFKLEFTIKPLDNVEFSCSAFNSEDSSSINKMAIAYYNNQLYINYNGSWAATGVQLSQNRWTQIRFIGDIFSGTYDVYINEDDEDDWQYLGTSIFDNAEVSAITGIYIYPWSQGQRLFVDDVKLVSLDVNTCDELLLTGEKLLGDINLDCYVDFYDLLIISESWLKTSFD